jgi:phage/plasmid-associated DNA primase
MNSQSKLLPTSTNAKATATRKQKAVAISSQTPPTGCLFQTVDEPPRSKNAANDELRKFLQNHQTTDKHKKTHTLFNGSVLDVKGPFCIEDADRNRFYELYTKCHGAGTRLNFVEQKPSKKWPFFLDCDGKPDDTPTILKHIESFKAALQAIIIPETLKLAFGVTNPQLEFHNKVSNPTRFHVFLNREANIVLDSESASAVRAHLIQSSLEWSGKTLSKPFPEPELTKFIDAVMQTSVGLRMYGSLKLDPKDTDYVQPDHPVSVESLHRYSIQPVGIADKPLSELTPKMQKWWKTRCKTSAAIAKEKQHVKAQSTRKTIVAKANTRSIPDANIKILACAAKHNLTVHVDAQGLHAITPNTSQCPVCQRMHEHERGFLFIDDFGIKCFCFRAHGEHHGEPGKNNGNPDIEYIILLEAFVRSIPTLEGLIDHGAMYWAEFLVDTVGHDIKTCGDKIATFFVFQQSDALWIESDGPSLIRRAVYSELLPKLQSLHDELHSNKAFEDDPTLSKKFERAVYNCTDIRFLDQIATGFKSFAQCKIEHPAKVFNQNKELLSVENGVIDVRSLQLRPRTREDMFTIKVSHKITQAQLDKSIKRVLLHSNADVRYKAALATFLPNRDNHPVDAPEFFDQIFYSDVWEFETDRVHFVKQCMGVGLLGHTNSSRVLIFYGKGSNFKSMFNRLLLNQGDFHKSISYDALCVQSGLNNDELYAAQYARVLTFNETDPEKQFDWTQLLKLSGGDQLNPMAKFKTNRAYAPQFDVIGFCNDLPKPPSKMPHAKRRRVIPIKMRKVYLQRGDPVDEIEIRRLEAAGTPELIGTKDAKLDQKLDSRAVGWLLWQLEGAHEYCQHPTITIPPSLANDLTDRYDSKQITPEKFLAQRYKITSEPHANQADWISIQQLHQEYITFDGVGNTNKSIPLNSFSHKIQDYMSQQGTEAITQRMEFTLQNKKQKLTMICNLSPCGTIIKEKTDTDWKGE